MRPVTYWKMAIVAVLSAGFAGLNGASAQVAAAAKAGQIGAPGGTGRYPAIAEARSDAPGYTIYRPERMPGKAMPLVVWGNGGCRNDGLSAQHFLREIASHGYVVVANGAPVEQQVPQAAGAEIARGDPSPPVQRNTPDETSVSGFLAAIDWAVQASQRKGDALFNRVDLSRIAATGHSCGGLQALSAGADPRIATVIVFASGVYNAPGNRLSGVAIGKADLARLHTPVAYVLGGPADIAYPNGMDDWTRIDHVPVIAANQNVGHGGTFSMTNGGTWAQFATHWLDWQLKGRQRAGRWFVGKNCGLCRNPEWTIMRKHFPEKS